MDSKLSRSDNVVFFPPFNHRSVERTLSSGRLSQNPMKPMQSVGIESVAPMLSKKRRLQGNQSSMNEYQTQTKFCSYDGKFPSTKTQIPPLKKCLEGIRPKAEKRSKPSGLPPYLPPTKRLSLMENFPIRSRPRQALSRGRHESGHQALSNPPVKRDFLRTYIQHFEKKVEAKTYAESEEFHRKMRRLQQEKEKSRQVGNQYKNYKKKEQEKNKTYSISTSAAHTAYTAKRDGSLKDHRATPDGSLAASPRDETFMQPLILSEPKIIVDNQAQPAKEQDGPLAAVPFAINSGQRYMRFRPLRQPELWTNPAEGAVPLHTDKGYYYKFNSNTEIKLVKLTLEDNGFLPQPYRVKQMSATYKMMHGGAKSEVRTQGDDWLLLWSSKQLKLAQFGSLKKFQRVNQFPKSFELTRKDLLVERVQKMQEIYTARQFDYIPPTLVLPREAGKLEQEMRLHPDQPWIIKPISGSQGKGIYITKNFQDINFNGREAMPPMIASHYIDNPMLINGLKFDLRLYVVVTSFYPLRIYVYEEGLTRFATTKYERAAGANADLNNKEGKYTHLTNYSLNKFNKKGFVQNTSAEEDKQGSKWSLSALRELLRENGIDDKAIFAKINDVIVKTLISVEPIMTQAHSQYVPHRSNCFQLFGFDILIDDRLNPWLLEINLSPSLACDSPLDQKIKASLVADLLNLVGVVNKQYQRGASQIHGGGIFAQSQTKALINSYDQNINLLNRPRLELNEKALPPVAEPRGSQKEELVLQESEAEIARRGRFQLVFPFPHAHIMQGIYKSFYDDTGVKQKPLNQQLLERLQKKGLF